MAKHGPKAPKSYGGGKAKGAAKGPSMQQKKRRAPNVGKAPSAPMAKGVVSTSDKKKKRKAAPAPAPAPALGGRKALKVTTVRGGEVAESVRLWNVFRAKALDASKRQKAVAAALGALKGKLYEASLKHDAARVVQALIKWGDAEQRKIVQAELAPRLAELSRLPYEPASTSPSRRGDAADFRGVGLRSFRTRPQSAACFLRYARHVALCLLRHSRGDEDRKVFESFRGGFQKIATHATGAKVADAALAVVSKADAKALRAELLGPDAALLLASRGRASPPALADVLAANAGRRGVVLDGVDRVARKLCDKSLVHHRFAQDLLFEHATPRRFQVVAIIASRRRR